MLQGSPLTLGKLTVYQLQAQFTVAHKISIIFNRVKPQFFSSLVITIVTHIQTQGDGDFGR